MAFAIVGSAAVVSPSNFGSVETSAMTLEGDYLGMYHDTYGSGRELELNDQTKQSNIVKVNTDAALHVVLPMLGYSNEFVPQLNEIEENYEKDSEEYLAAKKEFLCKYVEFTDETCTTADYIRFPYTYLGVDYNYKITRVNDCIVIYEPSSGVLTQTTLDYANYFGINPDTMAKHNSTEEKNAIMMDIASSSVSDPVIIYDTGVVSNWYAKASTIISPEFVLNLVSPFSTGMTKVISDQLGIDGDTAENINNCISPEGGGCSLAKFDSLPSNVDLNVYAEGWQFVSQDTELFSISDDMYTEVFGSKELPNSASYFSMPSSVSKDLNRFNIILNNSTAEVSCVYTDAGTIFKGERSWFILDNNSITVVNDADMKLDFIRNLDWHTLEFDINDNSTSDAEEETIKYVWRTVLSSGENTNFVVNDYTGTPYKDFYGVLCDVSQKDVSLTFGINMYGRNGVLTISDGLGLFNADRLNMYAGTIEAENGFNISFEDYNDYMNKPVEYDVIGDFTKDIYFLRCGSLNYTALDGSDGRVNVVSTYSYNDVDVESEKEFTSAPNVTVRNIEDMETTIKSGVLGDVILNVESSFEDFIDNDSDMCLVVDLNEVTEDKLEYCSVKLEFTDYKCSFNLRDVNKYLSEVDYDHGTLLNEEGFVKNGFVIDKDFLHFIGAIEDYENPAEEEVDYGNVNADDKVDIRDVTMLNQYIIKAVDLSDAQIRNADIIEDGVISIADLGQLKKFILKLTDTIHPTSAA